MVIENQPNPTETPQQPAAPAAVPATPAQTPPAEPAQPPAEAPPAETPPPAAASASPDPERRILTIPTSAMKNIKQEERDRGKNEALAALDAEAVQLGFANYAELRAYAKAQKESSATPPASPAPAEEVIDDDDDFDDEPAQASETPPKESKRNRSLLRQLEQDREKLLEEKRRLNRARSREVRENKQLKRQLQEMETTTELKLAAKDAGVADVDYAVELLKRNLRTMSDEDLQKFDERKYFRESLRKSHPHLYKAEERPVTTGVVDTPPTPANGKPEAGKPNGDHKQVDARALSPKEFQELLRKRGISSPSSGGMLA